MTATGQQTGYDISTRSWSQNEEIFALPLAIVILVEVGMAIDLTGAHPISRSSNVT